MSEKPIKILAIETSCDETAASLIEEINGQPAIISNIISSQIDLHKKTGGVVPEVASRAHMEAIVPVIQEALGEIKLNEITHIAVTAGPGLIGSLLVGFNAGKTLAYSLDLPILPINHIEGHIYSTILNTKQELENKSDNDGQFPVLALTVSGGHTSLTLLKDHLDYEAIGATLDDAAGEAFDKVAKLLDLGYPGGPIVSKLAEQFRESGKTAEITFPRPILNDGTFNFSFSGLKTAVLQVVRNLGEISEEKKAEICYAFEEAAIDVLATKTMRAAEEYQVKGILLGGGVSANRRLQTELKNRIEQYNVEAEKANRLNYYLPPKDMMGDNAAMIGLAAYYHIKRNDLKSWDEITVDSNLELA